MARLYRAHILGGMVDVARDGTELVYMASILCRAHASMEVAGVREL